MPYLEQSHYLSWLQVHQAAVIFDNFVHVFSDCSKYDHSLCFEIESELVYHFYVLLNPI